MPGAAIDGEIGITRFELWVMVLGMLMLACLLVWLAIMGLDYLVPGRGVKRRFVKMMKSGWKKKGWRENEEESEGSSGWEEIETIVGRRASVTGPDVENGEWIGEQLGIQEPRRRLGIKGAHKDAESFGMKSSEKGC